MAVAAGLCTNLTNPARVCVQVKFVGALKREMKRISNGQVYLISGGPDTGSHGTTGSQAKFYAT